MKDLNVLPEELRGAAKADGSDYAWPLDMAGPVIAALVESGAVVISVEAWVVDDEGVPAVVGWSSYEVGDYRKDWGGSVARAKAEAENLLSGILATATEENVNYVGIGWATEPADIAKAEEFF